MTRTEKGFKDQSPAAQERDDDGDPEQRDLLVQDDF